MSPTKVGAEDGLPSVTVRDGGEFVVSKVLTQKGEKLEVRDVSRDESLRLDALTLESLSWQPDLASLAQVLDLSTTAVTPPDDATATGDRIDVANEYAICAVQKLDADGSSCLAVASESGESSTVLTGAALAAVAGFSNEFAFSAEFSSPFGPEQKRQFDAPF